MSHTRFAPPAARSRWLLALVGVAVALGGFTAPAPAFADTQIATPPTLQDLRSISNAYAEVVERVSPAVVFIQVTRREEVRQQRRGGIEEFFNDPMFERFFGPQFRPPGRGEEQTPQERFRQGSGSGFFISADGLIITNHHVAGDADSVTVRTVDGREYDAEVVGSDEPSDVALLRVQGNNFPYLELGDSDALRVGEWVLAIGAPFGLTSTVTQGIVSAKGRGVGILEYEDFIQTDAAINLGNSGGPLIDLNGRVVGVNTAIMSRSGGSMGIGLAIPINSVEMVRDELLASGVVNRGFVGVSMQDLTPDMAEAFGVEPYSGVLVQEVLPDSPAEKAGLQQGDIIVRYDGQAVDSATGFRTRVAFTKPGETRDIVVLRGGGGGEEISSAITLVPRTEFMAAANEPEVNTVREAGMTVQNLTEEMAQQLNYTGHEGVVVTEVTPGSPAQRANLARGMLIQEVNNEPVRTVAEFEAALAAADRDRPVLLLVRFRDTSNFRTLRLPQ